MDIGRKIKQRRIELDLTQEELGQRLGIKKSAVSRLESEEADNFSVGRIIKIAQALDTTPGYLTGWTDARTLGSDPFTRNVIFLVYIRQFVFKNIRMGSDPVNIVESNHNTNEER